MVNTVTYIDADEETVLGELAIRRQRWHPNLVGRQPSHTLSARMHFLKPMGLIFGSTLQPPGELLKITNVWASFQNKRIRISGVEKQLVIWHHVILFLIGVKFT